LWFVWVGKLDIDKDMENIGCEGDSRELGEQDYTFAHMLRVSRFLCDTPTTLRSAEAVTEPYVLSVARRQYRSQILILCVPWRVWRL